MKRPWALLISWDGAAFKGWQPQPDVPTVAGALKRALQQAGLAVHPWGAARTDAGVHARAQVASFFSDAPLDPDALVPEVNAHLPSSIRLVAMREAPAGFHAQSSACGKVYRYAVGFGDTGPRAMRLPNLKFPVERLDVGPTEAALRRLAVAPDLRALCFGPPGPPRRLRRASLVAFDARGAVFEFEAEGFGRYLVRNLVSLLLARASGAIGDEEFDAILTGESPRPRRAEPEGLVLHQVLYPPELDPFPDLEALAPIA